MYIYIYIHIYTYTPWKARATREGLYQVLSSSPFCHLFFFITLKPRVD